MASIRNRKGKWAVRVVRKGYPDQYATFISKMDAEKWARQVEAEMDRGSYVSLSEAQQTTLGEVIARFIREVLPGMKSAKDDGIRLNAIKTRPIAQYSMAALTPARIAAYRDERLAEVKPDTVIRELAFLSSIINHARREWDINVPNPVASVRKPKPGAWRDRTLSRAEEALLLHAVEPTGRRNPWTKPLVVLALETAMRQGELLALRWENVELANRVARLPQTKNGDSRTVPLSTRAVETLRQLPRCVTGEVFPLRKAALHRIFARATERAGLTDFRFHDLRHTAITRMASKLPNVIELSAVTGHRSLSMLKRYYHPSAMDLARKLG
jgi:integrase